MISDVTEGEHLRNGGTAVIVDLDPIGDPDPCPLGELDVRSQTDANDNEIGLDDASTVGSDDDPSWRFLHGRDALAHPEVDSGGTMHSPHGTPDFSSQRGNHRVVLDVEDRDVAAQRARLRRHLAADEPGPDDRHGIGLSQKRPDPTGVSEGPKRRDRTRGH